MNYSITINAPIEEVFGLYTNNNNLSKWQENLISYKPMKGNPGEVASVCEITYKPVTIYETIKSITLGTEIVCEYEHTRKGATKMYHTSTTRFNKLNQDSTKIDLKVDQKVVGLIPRMVMKLMAGSVKKHHQMRLEEFKAFAENQ